MTDHGSKEGHDLYVGPSPRNCRVCFRHEPEHGQDCWRAQVKVRDSDIAAHYRFMADVAEALLGPPEEGTEWGGGGILGGIKKLKDERDRARSQLMFLRSSSRAVVMDFRAGRSIADSIRALEAVLSAEEPT